MLVGWLLAGRDNSSTSFKQSELDLSTGCITSRQESWTLLCRRQFLSECLLLLLLLLPSSWCCLPAGATIVTASPATVILFLHTPGFQLLWQGPPTVSLLFPLLPQMLFLFHLMLLQMSHHSHYSNVLFSSLPTVTANVLQLNCYWTRQKEKKLFVSLVLLSVASASLCCVSCSNILATPTERGSGRL